MTECYCTYSDEAMQTKYVHARNTETQISGTVIFDSRPRIDFVIFTILWNASIEILRATTFYIVTTEKTHFKIEII